MNRIFTLFILTCFASSLFSQTSFTPGNLVVLQTSNTASKVVSPITLTEFTTDGAPGIAVTLPSSGPSPIQTAGIFGGSEGFLTTSTDNHFLVLGGYLTSATSGDVTATAASTVPRIVGMVSPSGNYTQAGISTTNYNLNDIRGAISDGTNFWASGASVASVDGIDYYGPGAPAALGVGTNPPKAYGLRIFNGQIYYSSQKAGPSNSSSQLGIFSLGNGTPTAGTIAPVQLINTGTVIPEDFSINPTTDVCYIAVNLNTAAGGIQKWVKSGLTWSLAYTLGTGVINTGAYGLVVDYTAPFPVLYASTFEATGNRIIKIIDNGSLGTAIISTLVPATANVFYKGISFAPVAGGLPVVNLSVSADTASEAAATVITVTANASSAVVGDQNISLGVSGTGITPGDYTVSNTIISIPNGATSGSVTFTVIDDTVKESTDTAILTISNPSAGITIGVNQASIIIRDNDGNRPPAITMNTAATSDFIDGGSLVSPVTPFTLSGVISDPTDPVATSGISFSVSDAETAADDLVFTATSSNVSVVPDANLVISGNGSSRNIKIIPAAVGYSTITISISDATNTTSYILNYAASAASVTPANTLWHTGMSDGSDAIALDDNYYISGDDELNILNVYSRSSSGLPLASYNYSSNLNLPDPGKPEADLEAAARSINNSNRIYWLGSMSNGKAPFDNKPNRDRLFATTVSGTGAATSFTFAGYCALRSSLIAWGDTNGYNFSASAAAGVDSKTPAGFAAEGMVFGPDSTTLYIGLRAPLVPTSSRTNAVIAPIVQFETWFNNGAPSGNPVFGTPIELNLGGRGIRDIIRLSNATYIILAGNSGSDPVTGALYKWTGKPQDLPILINSPVSDALNMEGAMQVNENGQLSLTRLQVISDLGDQILYNDGNEAKDFGDLILRKFRSDDLSSLNLELPPPVSIKILNPVNGAVFQAGSNISLEAQASAVNGSITKVEFFNKGIKFGEDTTAPYGYPGQAIEAGDYILTAKATDNNGDSAVSDTVSITVTGCSGSGSITGEGYTNIDGSQVSDLTSDPSYPDHPTVTASLNKFEYGPNLGDRYGARVRGYVCAPESGFYTFYIAADDQAGLWISTDDNPLNKILVAYNKTWVAPRAWYSYSTQKSAPIKLIRGVRYYIETLHKEYTGSDHLSVAWVLPDGTFEAPIQGNHLSPWDTSSIHAALSVESAGFNRAMETVDRSSPEGLQIMASPNPTDNYFRLTIRSDQETPVSITITDVLGRVIEIRDHIPSNGDIILGNAYKPGIYIVKIIQGNKSKNLKLVKH